MSVVVTAVSILFSQSHEAGREDGSRLVKEGREEGKEEGWNKEERGKKERGERRKEGRRKESKEASQEDSIGK